MQFFAPRGTYRQGEAPYDIFKNRMAAIKSIVETVKTNIANKYWDQLNQVTISELHKKLSKDQEVEKLNLYGNEPSKNIYPQNTEEIATQLVDYTMGKMLGKEIMMGRLPAMGTPTSTDLKYQPQTEPDLKYQPTEEVMMPKVNKQKLLDYVMSGGEMDWGKILKVMEERPSSLGEYSDLEKAALNSVMGRDVMGELETGVKRANLIADYFKEPEKKLATTMTELAQTDWDKFVEIKILEEELNMTTAQKNMIMYTDMYNEEKITRDEYMQAIGTRVAPAKLSEFERKLELLKETGMWNTMTDDNKLKFFSAYVAPEEAGGGLKDLTGADINTYNKIFYGDEEDWGVITPEEYTEAKDTWEKTNKNLPAPTYLKIMERNLKECLDDDNTITSRDDKDKVTDYWFNQYEMLYPYYEEALDGKMPKYLPPDKIHKVGGIEGAITGGGVTKGQYGSALVEGQETKKGTKEKAPEGAKEKEDEFGYIVGAVYKNADGKLLKYLGDNEWQEISPTVEGKTRGIK